MAVETSKQKAPAAPIDIPLPERVMLENGTMFVTLRTLEELEQFWREHQGEFSHACQGIAVERGPNFLRDYEWVFGSSRDAVVRTVMRWGQSSIHCEFYDQAKHDPREHAFFFKDQDIYRKHSIEEGTWSDEDESRYQNLTPEMYRGWWRLNGLPKGYSPADWFSSGEHEDVSDHSLSVDEATVILLEQTFDEWQHHSGEWEVEAHDHDGVSKTIQYWRDEQAAGESYYGDENE